jgi:hypothetical protein
MENLYEEEKGKLGLVSSDLQDVYIGETIGDESGYKIVLFRVSGN